MLRARLLPLALLLAPIPAIADPHVGKPAPNAQFKTVKGEKFDLASLRGKVVVINFWATWCEPCKRELPLLDSYYREVKDYGVVVLAATTEDSVPDIRLRNLFGMMAITPLRGVHGPYSPLEGVPTNYVIDRAGVLRYAKAGAFTLDSLNAILIPLINTPAPEDAATSTTAAAPPKSG